ncbi:MAG: carboxypeptidase-like regulatory domain-containing protein, partial [Bacteroidota bacterium]|nr:carboxypeptidase-like regulatory domain-containing protein [Bacteroidota bacterium]
MKFSALIFFLLLPGLLAAQGVISGSVQEAESGEAVIGANVLLVGTGKGAATNRYGYFALAGLKPGKYTLRISAVGFRTDERSITITNSEEHRLVVELLPSVIELGEVSIEATRQEAEARRLSAVDLPIEQILRLPSLGGEVDVFRALQLLMPLGYAVASALLTASGCSEHYAPDCNLARAVDRAVLTPAHSMQPTDPEGLLSS